MNSENLIGKTSPLQQLFDWNYIGWAVAILVSMGIGMLQLTEFRAAKACFTLSAILLWAKVLVWGITTYSQFRYRAVVVAICFAAVGVILVESFRWIERKKFSTSATSGQTSPQGGSTAATSPHPQLVAPSITPPATLTTQKLQAQSIPKLTPVPAPSILVPKHEKKPESAPPQTDRSIKVGDNSQVIGSPMTTGDKSPITINPEVNPNAPIVTYEFNGVRHEQQGGRFSATAGDELGVFKRLTELQREHNWQEMYSLSESQIKETPEWLTPYLFSGIALANLGRKAEAIKRLKYVDHMAAGQADYSDAARILGLLGDQ